MSTAYVVVLYRLIYLNLKLLLEYFPFLVASSIFHTRHTLPENDIKVTKNIHIIIKVYNRISDPLNLPVSKYPYFKLSCFHLLYIFFVLWVAGIDCEVKRRNPVVTSVYN